MTPYSDQLPVRLYAGGMGIVLAVAAGVVVGALGAAGATWAWLIRQSHFT